MSVNRVVPQDPSDPGWQAPPGQGLLAYTPRPDIVALEDAQTAHDNPEPKMSHGYLRMWKENLATLVVFALVLAVCVALVLVAYYKNHGGL